MPESAIVINTGPILALIAATGDLSLPPKIYSRIIVPREVCDEVLANGGTMFGAAEFASADGIERQMESVEIGSLLSQLLDRGEASVVQLAISEGIETVCIDEHLGRRVARLNGLRVTGSLGILIRAKREGHSLCLSDAVSRMREAGVFLSDDGRRGASARRKLIADRVAMVQSSLRDEMVGRDGRPCVETHGDLRRSLCDQGQEPMSHPTLSDPTTSGSLDDVTCEWRCDKSTMCC